MLKISLVVVRTLDYGDARIATRKQVRRPQQGTDTYTAGVTSLGIERRVDSWCFVGLRGEERRKIKDDSLGAGWMDGAI